ncbi:MAG: transglutaminase-like cysteine peptidase [Methylovirgula sp.]
MHTWARLRADLSGKAVSPFEILRRVNAEVDAGIRYRSDTDNYGAPDYWASPAEVARRHSADCKEFALVKMWMLAALGFRIRACVSLLSKISKTARGTPS